MKQKKIRFLSNEYFEEVVKLSGACWQIGSAVTFFFSCFTLYLFKWAAHESVVRESTALGVETCIGSIDGDIVYLLPALFTFITLHFAWRTVRSSLDRFPGVGRKVALLDPFKVLLRS